MDLLYLGQYPIDIDRLYFHIAFALDTSLDRN
jgi:hypothetical protein